jgi:hypothetical protein
MMEMYFSNFTSYNDIVEGSKSFIIRVFLKRPGSSGATHIDSSAVPNTPDARKAVMTAIAASTANEFAEPFYLWSHGYMKVIPANVIETIQIEFAPLQ